MDDNLKPSSVDEDPIRDSNSNYAAMRDEFIALGRALSESESATIVPDCPAWTVRDVLAHVTGVNFDVIGGHVADLGSDLWTQGQVGSRAQLSTDQVCDEWESLAQRTTDFISSEPFWGVRIGADLVTHIHDVLDALGRSDEMFEVARRDGAGIRSALSRYAPFFCERAATAGLPTVQVSAVPDETASQTWTSGDGAVTAELSGSAFDLLRALTGRRGVESVLAMDWEGDPTPYLAVVNPYGALKPGR